MSNHCGIMTNKNKTKFPPLFPKIPQVEDVIIKKSIGSDIAWTIFAYEHCWLFMFKFVNN